ncbi:molybdenum cofactor guanylyltransferase [Aestuariirhabdus sp. Z084]|uniref:molybdenum cofactor guanylyltransferase MobA n=1 Tax=Aestuariirhabdus haliotis TaxID=2918751 RepID=UPI00201B413B|nr:molybdenum cofactor guanylyltransferase MobA [Aestuariirhabdus haliotis]MCL6416262.1 molybdenum cofactor guanylyltransferase [Aestuariirhabdus haliotis]MCL6420278.1 molybdenum cofactor guanylyltransferase [Aestuariirhabdus haliotis]
MNKPIAVDGVILAGGEARRMGGEDKGLVTLAGRPMIEHVIARFEPQVNALIINANRNHDRYARTGFGIVSDRDIGEYPGPLAGMAAGLAASEAELVAFVPCDAPLLPRDLVLRLSQALQQQQTDIAVAHDGDYWQPVFVLMKRTLLPSLDAFLSGEGRKIMHWFQQQKMAKVLFDDQLNAFENINTPEHCQRIEQQMMES